MADEIEEQRRSVQIEKAIPQQYRVSLPCEPEEFTQFVAGLLGKPQSISFRLEESFEVNRHDLESLHHLIMQRVISQNEGQLAQFSATMGYDDNTTVRINSFEGFANHVEVKSLISSSVLMSLVFLIQFRNKKILEKQEIVIEFHKSGFTESRSSGVDLRRIFVERTSQIVCRIDHTDRSWGVDIENLLRGQLQTHLRPLVGTQSFMDRYCGSFGTAIGLFVFLAGSAASFKYTNSVSRDLLLRAKPLTGPSGASSILDLLGNLPILTRRLKYQPAEYGLSSL